MDSHQLLLLGAGGHAAVVAEAARASGWLILGYCTDHPSPDGFPLDEDIPWVGPPDPESCAHLAEGGQPPSVIAAVGDPRLRSLWTTDFTRRGHPLATIIDPASRISSSARIEDGVFVGPLACINAGSRIGRSSIINSSAVVEHGCVLDPLVHIAPGAILTGEVTIGEGTLVGAGSVVLPGLEIGAWTTIGAGSVVQRDVPSECVVAGVPARELVR